MAGNTDERIIQMKFENRQFERNIAQSKKSIEDFKKIMNFGDTSRDLEDFTKATNKLNFSTLMENVQKLTDRFTGLGDVGDYVLRRIRAGFDSIASSAEHFIKGLSIDQIVVGQGKYDALNKAVMTITATGEYTEEKAYEVFDRLMTYTNQTSYSFSDMVNQIASFTSTGVKLDSAEAAMEGIANLSAKAGQGVSQASNAMSIFSKALGQGFLGLNQWQSLNLSAHIITKEFRQVLADTAVEMKTLTKEGDKYYTNTKKGKKTLVEVSNLENTLNQQWATSEVLLKTLQKYYFHDIDNPDSPAWDTEFAGSAAKAAQRALSFTDAINAMKETVSAGWLESYRIIFGDLSEAMEFFTNVADRAWETLTKIKDFRNEVLRDWASNGGRGSLIEILLGDYGKEEDAAKGAYGIIDMIDDVGKLLYEGFMDFVGIFAGADDRAMFKDPEEGVTYFREWLGIQLAKITASVEGFLQRIRNWFNETINVGGESKTRLELLHEIIMGIVAVLALGIQVVMGIGSFLLAIAGQLQPSFDKIEEFLGTLGLTLYDTSAAATEAKTIPQYFQELAETFKPLTDGINEVVGAFTELLGVILDSDQQNGTTNGFLSFIGEGLKFIAGIITSIGVPVLNFIKNLIKTVTELFSGEAANKSGQQSTGLLGAIGNLISGIVSGFNENGFETLHARFENVINWFKNVNLGAVLAAVLGVLTVAKIIQVLHNVKKAFSKITAFFDDPGRALKQGFIGDYEWFSERVLNISKAIALLAASVVVLGSMPTNNLIKGILAVVALMGAIFAFTKLMEGIKGTHFSQVATTAKIMMVALGVSAMTVSLAILIASLESMKDVTWEQYGKMMAGLGGVLLELVAFMLLTSYLPIGTGQLGGFIGFALSIGILVKAITPFANMNWDQYAKMMAGLAGILIEIIGFMELFKIAGLSTKAMKFNGIISFSLAIAILVFALTPLANISWEGLGKMMAGLGVVLLEIIGFMTLFKVAGLSTKALKFDGIIKFMLGIAILMEVIKPLANISWEGLDKMAAGLGVVLLEIIGFMTLFKVAGLSTKALNFNGIIKFMLAIAILMEVIKPLANISWEGLGKMMAGLGAVLLEIIGFMTLFKVAGLSTKALDFAGILSFAVSIWIIVNAIRPFADMNWDQYGRVMAGLGGILLELVAFMALMKLLKVDTVQIAGLILFAIGLSVLIKSFEVFKDMDIMQVMAGLVGVGGLLLMLAMFMEATKKLKFNMKNMLAIGIAVAALSVLMLAFSASLSLVKDMDWGLVAAFAGGLSVLLIALAGAIVILSGVPIVAGLKAIVLIGAALTAILGVVALMAPILLGSLGSSLANMSGKLAIMADMFSIFSTRMAGADENGMTKAKKMIDDLYDLLGDMNKFGTMKLSSSTTSSVLFNLGTGLESFAYHSKAASDASTGLQFIKDLAGCATDLDTISRMSLTNLSSNIAGLGGAMMLYAKGAVEVSTEGISEDIDLGGAVQLMNKISEALVEKGGFTIPPNMPEPEDIGNFGAQLAALAGALVLIEEAGRGFGTGTENTIRALQFFQNLKVELEKTAFIEGIRAVLGFNIEFATTGNLTSELKKFGENIEALGFALKSFADSTTTVDESTGEIKPTSYEEAIEALTRFSELETKLPKLVGITHWWTGQQQTLSDFGNDIQQLGSGLMTFSNKITGQGTEGQEGIKFDPTAAGEALTAMEGMVSFIQDVNAKLPKLGGIKNFFVNLWTGDGYSFKELGDQLGQMGDGLGALGEGLNKGGWSKDTGVTVALDALESIMVIMAKLQDIEGAAQRTGYNASALGDVFAKFIGDFSMNTDGLENMVWMMTEISSLFDQYAADGDVVNNSNIEAFEHMASALASLASIDPKYDWKTIGLQIDTGIGNGLLEGIETVKAAATTVTTGAYDVAVEKATTIVATISQILSDQLVAQPTISPVLDMTDATAKFNQFTSMVGSKPVTIDGTRAALMAGALGNQNGTDLSGVHSRMDKIEHSINELGTAIGNMRIVLDTGLMVGALTPGIDGNIGRRQWLAARRNTVNGNGP